jgi:tetratricopeptide (TPR) repeat protein
MSATLTTSEESQLAQTIEMFEVITQSQPQDYQSLEILKEAYAKLGREKDAINTSKRIAEAYVQMGQISSAILEYETILQRVPGDGDARAALNRIESQAGTLAIAEGQADFKTAPGQTEFKVAPATAPAIPGRNGPVAATGAGKAPAAAHVPKPIPANVEDGKRTMQKLFVDSKVIGLSDFEACWPKPDFNGANSVVDPFIQRLADKGILPPERALKIMCDHSRIAFIPLQNYEIDMDLARTFPADICRRWCILPFDRMSKCILVATANPYNQYAARELAESTPNRLLWYVVSPVELLKTLKKAFR